MKTSVLRAVAEKANAFSQGIVSRGIVSRGIVSRGFVSRGIVSTGSGWTGVGLSVMFVMIGLAGLLGCDRTSKLAETKAPRASRLASSDAATTQLLEKCIAAYTRVARYSDAARVVLTYKVDGEVAQDVAPLSVALERPNRVGIKAYQVTAGSTENRFRMRLTSDADSPVRTQVVSRALPSQIDMNWLMLDGVAAQHLGAGLAGPPPQLALLLSDEPLGALLDAEAIASLDGQGKEADRTFDIVKIVRGATQVRLWIDAQTFLLRRIELPTAALPETMLADQRITDIRLSIELDDVQTGLEVAWSEWQVPIVALDQLVRYFVAPPAIALDSRLGKAVPAFRLKSVAGSETIDSSELALSKKIQLFVWLADHPSCRTTLQQIGQALKQLPPETRSQIAPVAVWAEPEPAQGTTFDNLAAQWNLGDMPMVVDREALGRDVLGVAEAPSIVVLDRQHRLQFFQERAHPLLVQALPQLLTRLAGGESLADTMNEQARSEQERFVAQLWLARASDAVNGAFAPPKPYMPQWVKLEEQSRQAIPTGIIALTSDAQHNLWTLKSDGELECSDSLGRSLARYDTQWNSNAGTSTAAGAADSVRLVIEDAGKFVAIRTGASAELMILDTTSRKTARVALGGVQTVIDLRWLATAQGTRLAAITAEGRTVLIDPDSDEQLSGQSPARPMALLDPTATDAQASGYVILADGRIEPVILESQAGAHKSGLAKPVSATMPGRKPTEHTSLRPGAVESGTESPPSIAPEIANNPVIERQLRFTPMSGPWSRWQAGGVSTTLGRGLLARDEPAVFLLDEQLRQQWHAPLPLADGADTFLTSVARDPVSGQPLWVVVQPKQTLHFFRADGGLVDHGHFAAPIRGVALVPTGNELHLWLAHANALVHYRLQTQAVASEK